MMLVDLMATHRYRITVEALSHDARAALRFERFLFETSLHSDLFQCVAAAHAQTFVEEDLAAGYGIALPLLTEALSQQAGEPAFSSLLCQLRSLVEGLPDTKLLSELLFPQPSTDNRTPNTANRGQEP